MPARDSPFKQSRCLIPHQLATCTGLTTYHITGKGLASHLANSNMILCTKRAQDQDQVLLENAGVTYYGDLKLPFVVNKLYIFLEKAKCLSPFQRMRQVNFILVIACWLPNWDEQNKILIYSLTS